MPTKHRRLSITLDPELADALVRARRVEGREVADATLVRDLALRGEATLLTEERRRKRLLRELADPDFLPDLDFGALEEMEKEEMRKLTQGPHYREPEP